MFCKLSWISISTCVEIQIPISPLPRSARPRYPRIEGHPQKTLGTTQKSRIIFCRNPNFQIITLKTARIAGGPCARGPRIIDRLSPCAVISCLGGSPASRLDSDPIETDDHCPPKGDPKRGVRPKNDQKSLNCIAFSDPPFQIPLLGDGESRFRPSRPTMERRNSNAGTRRYNNDDNNDNSNNNNNNNNNNN